MLRDMEFISKTYFYIYFKIYMAVHIAKNAYFEPTKAIKIERVLPADLEL